MTADLDDPTPSRPVPVPHVGFVLERSLGHVTHADNLRRLLPAEPDIDAEILEIDWDVSGLGSRISGFNSNWTIRSGVRARTALRRADRRRRLDALFIHTQVPAVLVPDWLRRVPSVVSIDATPLQYDALGADYDHQRGNPRVENFKWRLNRSAFDRAAHIVAWSAWAKQGVVDGYGIDPGRVTVIPPGVVSSLWRQTAPARRDETVVRILFVGGDLERKGGSLLLRAFDELRSLLAAEHSRIDLALDLVTKAEVQTPAGVIVHRGLTPNSEALVKLFQDASIFCLPTRADCLPMVLSEAAAAGLPLVSTSVAGIPEIVKDGETGLVVAPDDQAGLVAALRALVENRELRERFGEASRQLAVREFDAGTNAHRLVELLASVAHDDVRRRGRRPRPTASDALEGRRGQVLLTVSGVVPDDVARQVADGERPCPDYVAIARAMDADLLDLAEARRRTGGVGRMIEKAGGGSALLAWACLRERSRYRCVVTDGEQVGLPLALLCRLTARRAFPHVMVVHIMSVSKKALPYRLFRLGRYIDTMVLYSSEQRRFAIEELGVAPERTVLTSFAVDTEFFNPEKVDARPRRMISTAGLEYRDYPTLVNAAEDIDAQIVIAAASPWSKRADSTAGAVLPPNVEVCKLGFRDLRQMYADSDLVVMPLHDVEFQAGVTTILEAMAMARAVVCSRTRGQTDVLSDGITGVYVPPAQSAALSAAITALLDDPTAAAMIGARARCYATEVADVRVYAERLADVVRGVEQRYR